MTKKESSSTIVLLITILKRFFHAHIELPQSRHFCKKDEIEIDCDDILWYDKTNLSLLI